MRILFGKTMFVCIISFLLLGSLSSAVQLDSKTSIDIVVNITPVDKNPSDVNVDGAPVVVIVSPENGTQLPNDSFEVLGYASDPDGMDHWQFVYECALGTSIKGENLSGGTYYVFRIQFFNIPPGKQKVTVTFCDVFDFCGSDVVTVYYAENNPPQTPTKPTGPESGTVDISYTFATSSIDPDNDSISYGWDWNGDNSVDEWTAYYPSGQTVSASHAWASTGTYNIKVKAKDERGAQSGFSSPLTVVISDNHAPGQPEKPTGNTNIRTGVSYSYSSNTTDSDNDRIYYIFDWDDGTDSGWIGPYDSGDTVSASHIWNNKGSFIIKIKAKDEHGAESTWSEPLPITVPKPKTLAGNLFERITILKQIFFLFFKK